MAHQPVLDFERPIFELENRIADLERFAHESGVDLSQEIARLRERCEKLRLEIFAGLTPWQRVKLARDLRRPTTDDYIRMMMTDFIELHGDRLFGDDPAVVTGLARLEGEKVLVVGHRKGRNVQENMKYNFGSAHPEGYRKALAKMKLAEKFRLPVITFINTPGAYPGIGAEERGQANAIAQNLMEMAMLRVPVVSVVIGEGGSGGAIGIGLADRLAMLSNAYFSVISPEGCAAILWKNAQKAPEAAAALRLTPTELHRLGVVDDVIQEPRGSAHYAPEETAQVLKEYLLATIRRLKALDVDTLLEQRYQRYRRIGQFLEEEKERIRMLAASHQAQAARRGGEEESPAG
jgi:acetyl-CoA carboxylase carboxyl transferase subunit alpha